MIAFAEPTEWWLEISRSSQEESWQRSQLYATPSSRRAAYINHTCLTVLLPWLQAEYSIEATALPAFWEIVNGTAIMIGERRIVLVPTEAIDGDNLEVPQEWVDIPSWASDYYLAVQVQLDEPWIRVWGYTTHQELKASGSYDPSDRTYYMDARNLTTDLHAFRIVCQFCLEEQTKAEIAPLPELPVAQAENLLQRLGSSAVVFPRLAVPFILWGALLEKQEWRQRLCQQRQTNRQDDVIASVIVHLNQWFQNSFEEGWQSLKDLFSLPENLAFRSALDANRVGVTRCKLVNLESLPENQAVVLLVGLETEADARVKIGVQLYPRDNSYVPAQMSLSLLSNTGVFLQSVQAQNRDDYLQLKPFRCPLGTRFSLQIAFNNNTATEDFVV